MPTDAAWRHPIEKRRRRLQQDVSHLPRWADDRAALRRPVGAFLDQFAHGPHALLR